MHIAVTGGTGYVGAHTVRALLEAGHRVRLLVTDSPTDAAVARGLAERGDVETLRGDVRDDRTISELLDGCDAVWHAAGVVGTDRRREQLMWEINAYATETLLRTAVEAGLDPVVSVSSYSALFPSPTGVIGPDTPPAAGRSPYARTKAYADRAARRLQADGAPVVVTYPSSVVGRAFLSAAGVTERGWAPMVRWRIAPRLRGGMQMIDVRDVAEVHARLMQPGRGPHRYICGGTLLTFEEMISALESGLGQPIRRVPVTPGVFRAFGRLSDAVGQVVPVGDGLSYEAAMLLTAATPTDDSTTRRDLGISWRSPVEAIRESFG
ncbi:NAD-dependent epimerase/dehydratase family protein [Mycolicibacterium thermoresistibile]